ncbi:M28 family peptidase [Nocardioides sp. R-C-SC26]|uniref:M28 family peptidase n=1 Tax=Nocardioides sp. R-C-SC26 TaxID=2870414 RepID=UPI001E2D3A3A|nr:M28 family peptidase [Nocardioides sp. R-C-SC26]
MARPARATPSQIAPASPREIASPGLLPGNRAILRTVRDLVEMAPRATGTPGGRQAAAYVARRFRAAGLSNVHYETARSYRWTPSDWGVSVGGRRFDTRPISHSFIRGADLAGTRTLGRRGVTAPVVDIGAGSVAGRDVRGKIVLFDLKFQMPLAVIAAASEFLYDPDLQLVDPETMLTANPYMTSLKTVMQEAIDGGAVGVVGVLADYFDSNRYHNEYYGSVPMTIPGFWVTKKEGAALRHSLETSSRATIRLTAERAAATGRTVVGFLPGRSRDTILIQSHHDSQGPGAVEDGTGAAEVIALADYYGALARRPGYRKPEKTLMFATFDTHFTGYQQHNAFTRKYVLGTKSGYRLVANAAIEHVGKQAKIAADGGLRVLDQPEPRGIFENLNPLLKARLAGIIVDNDLRGTAMLNATPMQGTVGIPTDANWALLSGVPVASLIAGPIYMYDEADTLDKVDVASLRPVARAYAQLVDAMQPMPSDLIGLTPTPVSTVIRDLWFQFLGP